jgi:putative ABC transport system permease protein
MREDLKTAIRSLLTSPTFTGVALLVLTLGIGASTAIFSVVDAVILKGLPYDEHDRLVALVEHDTLHPTTFGGGLTTLPTFLDWREHQQPFEHIAVTQGERFQLHTEAGEPGVAAAQEVTWEFFPVLHAAPMLGRAFTASDEGDPKQHRVVILSYGFWQRQFGGAPDVIGKPIELDGDAWEIVGVMPRGFIYPLGRPDPAELFTPMNIGPDARIHNTSRNYTCTVIGRLKPGVTIDQATRQMRQLDDALARQYPNWRRPGWTTDVMSLHERLVGKVRTWMLMLLAVVGLVLAIACANVANLMLVRATVRTREMAIRSALGANRWRLVRGLLIEGLVLSLAGAALGVLFALGGVDVLRLWLPRDVPRVAAIAIDLRVLGTALALAVLTGVVFGCVPAWQATQPDLVGGLKEGARGTTASGAAQRLRATLVVAEIALAVVLLVGAGLFIRSFITLTQVDMGFDYRNVLTLSVQYPVRRDQPEDAADLRATRKGNVFMQRVLEAIARVPGVESVGGVTGGLPLTGSWSRVAVSLPGKGEVKNDEDGLDRRTVSANYLQTMRIPLLRGRYLNDRDTENAPRVAVINRTAAQKYWPGQDALGQRFTVGKVEREVVGIVGDIHHLGPEEPVRPEAYFAAEQDQWSGGNLVIRTSRDPLTLLQPVKAAIWSLNPNQAFYDPIVTLGGYMDKFLAQRRFNMALLALFGIVGLVIAAAGLYGVMAYSVAQRTAEIGVRLALGATPADMFTMVLRQAALLTIVGIAAGTAGALSLASVVRAFLFQVDATDTRVFVLSLLSLGAVGLIATLLPARRAARVDPLIALRRE